MLGSRGGMAIRFSEEDLRPIGRAAMGVKSMELDEGDRVVAMCVVEEGAEVLAITELGYGKRTAIDEYRLQSRAGKGILAMRLTDKTGYLAGQMLVTDGEDILVITDDGTIIRTPVDTIPILGRATQGVRVMRVADGSRIASFERAEAEEEDADTEEPTEAEKDEEI
jgi:DNA gyrase subunit A